MQLRVPRCLIDAAQVNLPPADAEGLVTVRLRLDGAVVGAIEPTATGGTEPDGKPLPLAITPPVEPHAHLDKTFSHPAFSNSEGTIDSALAANRREFSQRTAAQVQQRSERALRQAWHHGLRAIRSHIDSGGGPASDASWEVLNAQRQRWQDRISLQLVAMVPIAHWLTPAGEALARQVAASGGLLGGVLGPPFGHGGNDSMALRRLLDLATRHGLGVDLHVDEGEDAPGCGVRQITRVAEDLRPEVPITCSHVSSMALLNSERCRRLADRMAAAGIAVVALPRTNLWLLGRRSGHTPWRRPQAPIRTLQRAGVEVAIGGDNVQDPWYPGGDYDPIDLLRLCFTTSHVDPCTRQGLVPFTSAAARLMGLGWDGVLRPGCPADLLLLEAASWNDVLARPPARRVMRGGTWLPPLPS